MLSGKQRKVIRARRMAGFFKEHIKSGDRALDIGCDDGSLTMALKSVLNVDLKLLGIDVAECDPPYDFKLIKEGNLPFKENEFDISLIIGVLHHMPYDKQMAVVKEAARVSKKVLIEEYPNCMFAKLIDILANKLNGTKSKLILTMRTLKEWNELFRENNLKREQRVVGSEFSHPINTYLFVVEK